MNGPRPHELHVVGRAVLERHALVERRGQHVEVQGRGLAQHGEGPLVRVRDDRDALVLEHAGPRLAPRRGPGRRPRAGWCAPPAHARPGAGRRPYPRRAQSAAAWPESPRRTLPPDVKTALSGSRNDPGSCRRSPASRASGVGGDGGRLVSSGTRRLVGGAVAPASAESSASRLRLRPRPENRARACLAATPAAATPPTSAEVAMRLPEPGSR